jgi:hypothetical protein
MFILIVIVIMSFLLGARRPLSAPPDGLVAEVAFGVTPSRVVLGFATQWATVIAIGSDVVASER